MVIKMKYFFIDERTSEEESDRLRIFGNIIKVPKHPSVYESVCGHTDLLINILNEKELLVHKDINTSFISLLNNLDIKVKLSLSSLEEGYPGNIILNGINLKNYFIHNLKYTDKNLLKEVNGKTLIHVKQGYSKCSTAIVTENAIITSDISIAKKLKELKFDVLLLPPGDIDLPGIDYGFIGGCSGLLDNNVMAFFGSLDNYFYGHEVKNFLKHHKVEAIYLSKGRLIDRGSIFAIEKNGTKVTV